MAIFAHTSFPKVVSMLVESVLNYPQFSTNQAEHYLWCIATIDYYGEGMTKAKPGSPNSFMVLTKFFLLPSETVRT